LLQTKDACPALGPERYSSASEYAIDPADRRFVPKPRRVIRHHLYERQ